LTPMLSHSCTCLCLLGRKEGRAAEHYAFPAENLALRYHVSRRRYKKKPLPSYKYHRAEESKWLRKGGFGIEKRPIINPSKVTIAILHPFAMAGDPMDLFTQILLLTLQLQHRTFDISSAVLTTKGSSTRAFLRPFMCSIKFSNPQALRTTVSWGYCQYCTMAAEICGYCLALESAPFFDELRSGKGEYKLLMDWEDVSYQDYQHGWLWTTELSLQKMIGPH
jgi:hypothetical protein